MPSLPPLPFLARILLRAAVVWVGLRGTLLLLFGLVIPVPLAAVAIAGIATLAVFLDLRRRHELLFLGNLGVSDVVIFGLSAVIPVAAEIAVRTIA